jgi:hypothetical protein
MNDQHVLALVEAIHGADFHTIHQLTFDAALIDYIGHRTSLLNGRGLRGGLCGPHTARGGCEAELRSLATQPAHRVTGVTSFVLLADIGDQCLRTLHLDLEGGDQRVFRVNDNVSPVFP